MNIPSFLQDKIMEFQTQTETFADLCECVDLAAYVNQGQPDSERLMMSAISSIKQEAKRLEEMSLDLFYELAQIC